MLRLPRADSIHQRTGFGMPHHDRRLPRFSTLQHARTRIQDKPPADAVGRMAVALEARAREDGLHRLLVEREVGGGGLGRGGVAGDGGEKRGGQQRGGGESEQVHRV